VVLISSRLGLVCAAPPSSGRKDPHQGEPPFYQRYGSKLPSSLTRDHSSTLACSASLPVSVCGTGTLTPPRAGLSRLFRRRSLAVTIAGAARTCLSVNETGMNPSLPTSLDGARLAADPAPQLPTRVKRCLGGTGLSTCCPSGSADASPLGPTNPPRITRAAEPSGFRWWGFAPHFSVTRSGIRTRTRSTAGFRCRFAARSTLPYHPSPEGLKS
jgi:hypothetical protein